MKFFFRFNQNINRYQLSISICNIYFCAVNCRWSIWLKTIYQINIRNRSHQTNNEEKNTKNVQINTDMKRFNLSTCNHLTFFCNCFVAAQQNVYTKAGKWIERKKNPIFFVLFSHKTIENFCCFLTNGVYWPRQAKV